jgi:hypothetical protein
MIKNLDSHVPHNYYLLTPTWMDSQWKLPNAYTHTYLTTTTIDGWQMGFTYVSLVMIDCIGKLVVPILVSMKKLEWNQKVDFSGTNILPKTWFLKFDFFYIHQYPS